jgi:signal transduction histidine kinase
LRGGYLGRVNRLRSLLTRYGVDVLVVVAAVASAAGALIRDDASAPEGALRLWLEALGMALVILVLLLRRRLPFVAPALTWLLAASMAFVSGPLVVGSPTAFLAGMGAAVLLGYLRSERQSRIGLVLVLACAATVVYNAPHSLADYLFTPMLFGTGWLVGFALRGRTEQTEAAEQRAALAEREREAAARVAVAEERSRIARELHDVVAHAVSVMVLQVGAVRHKMPESDAEDREALKNVEQAGRAALAEMRRLLDAMRREGDELELEPQPGLGNLDALLDDVRAAGLDVELHRHGAPVALPPALDLSAYRILQEGLTNALKHSGAERAEVELKYGERELLVSVRDDGRGPAAASNGAEHGSAQGSAHGLGHGLVGVRERVKIYGGDMSAGAEAGGGFTLRARLPYEGR